LVSAVAGAALLGGCSDGVEINSPLLDAVGLSTAALSRQEEPRLQPRAPLVIPPSTQRLPEPGQAQPAAVAKVDPAWPKDRDQERVASKKEKASRQADYCRDGNWKERSVDGGSSGYSNGPEGVCGSIFSVMGGWMNGSSSTGDKAGP
jgi:hypothetical protein